MKLKDSIRISIICPVYNVEKEVRRAIESVLKQDSTNLELVLIDDGSTDNSFNICLNYAKKYPDIIKLFHQENKGQLSARCLGIKNATGDVAVFLDSDDILLPNSLINIKKYFLADQTLDILIYSWELNIADKIVKGKEIFPHKTVFYEEKRKIYELILTTGELNSLSRKAIKMKLLKEDNTNYERYFDERLYEDLGQSFYAMTKAEKIMFVDDVCYQYIFRNNSITNTEAGLNKITLHNKIFNELLLTYAKKWELGIDVDQIIHLRVLNQLVNLVMYNLSLKKFERTYFLKLENKISKELNENRQYEKYIYNNNFKVKRKIYTILMAKGYIELIWLLQKFYSKVKRKRKYSTV